MRDGASAQNRRGHGFSLLSLSRQCRGGGEVRLSARGMKSDRATESVKRRAIQLRRKARGSGGSVLSGRRCFVTFVSSQPACC